MVYHLLLYCLPSFNLSVSRQTNNFCLWKAYCELLMTFASCDFVLTHQRCRKHFFPVLNSREPLRQVLFAGLQSSHIHHRKDTVRSFLLWSESEVIWQNLWTHPIPYWIKKKNTWNKHLWVRYMSLIVFYLQWFLKLIFLTLLRPSFKWLTITPLNERLMIFVFQENPNYHQVSCLDLYIAWKAVTLCTINQRLHYICGDQERSLEI